MLKFIRRRKLNVIYNVMLLQWCMVENFLIREYEEITLDIPKYLLLFMSFIQHPALVKNMQIRHCNFFNTGVNYYAYTYINIIIIDFVYFKIDIQIFRQSCKVVNIIEYNCSPQLRPRKRHVFLTLKKILILGLIEKGRLMKYTLNVTYNKVSYLSVI